jgi:hypothetical protein
VVAFAKEVCAEVVSLLAPSKQVGAVEAGEIVEGPRHRAVA